MRILVADDEEAIRKSHRYALETTAQIIKKECEVVEAADSIEAWQKIKAEKFNLILIDNDFKDARLKGHLPGIAILQLARKEGPNQETPIVFCSAETFETLAPMVERFGAVAFPKAGYDMESAARLFADQLTKPKP